MLRGKPGEGESETGREREEWREDPRARGWGAGGTRGDRRPGSWAPASGTRQPVPAVLRRHVGGIYDGGRKEPLQTTPDLGAKAPAQRWPLGGRSGTLALLGSLLLCRRRWRCQVSGAGLRGRTRLGARPPRGGAKLCRPLAWGSPAAPRCLRSPFPKGGP